MIIERAREGGGGGGKDNLLTNKECMLGFGYNTLVLPRFSELK